jgi:hypothetical protein
MIIDGKKLSTDFCCWVLQHIWLYFCRKMLLYWKPPLENTHFYRVHNKLPRPYNIWFLGVFANENKLNGILISIYIRVVRLMLCGDSTCGRKWDTYWPVSSFVDRVQAYYSRPTCMHAVVFKHNKTVGFLGAVILYFVTSTSGLLLLVLGSFREDTCVITCMSLILRWSTYLKRCMYTHAWKVVSILHDYQWWSIYLLNTLII